MKKADDLLFVRENLFEQIIVGIGDLLLHNLLDFIDLFFELLFGVDSDGQFKQAF